MTDAQVITGGHDLEMTDDGHLVLKLSRAWPDGRVMTGWVKWKRANA